MRLPKSEDGFSLVIVLVAGGIVLLALTGFGAFYFLTQGINKVKTTTTATPLPVIDAALPPAETEIIPTPVPSAVPTTTPVTGSNPVDEINNNNPFANPENPFTGVTQ